MLMMASTGMDAGCFLLRMACTVVADILRRAIQEGEFKSVQGRMLLSRPDELRFLGLNVYGCPIPLSLYSLMML
jgi:hypothetical protein